MIEPKAFPQEEQRIKSLHSLNLLDNPVEERFERITRMVCRVLDVPIAIFNLIDHNRQHYKSVQGLSVIDATLKAAFCTHTILENEMLLVEDTSKDNRFFDNPFVTGEILDMGFYAGCPVKAPDGMPIGTLCAIDRKPREMSKDQIESLKDLAAILETEIRIRTLTSDQEVLRDELDKANQLALIDPLSRLWNRQGIYKILEPAWSEAIRKQKPLTLVVADIDFFKKINDTFGHEAGDEAIRTVSKRLIQAVRNEDAVARIGGEEFLILLSDCLPDKVFETVERIRLRIDQSPMEIENYGIHVTMSFGAATVQPSQDNSYPELIKIADKALYEAKNSGRNRVIVAGI